jgi:hypothetical protein
MAGNNPCSIEKMIFQESLDSGAVTTKKQERTTTMAMTGLMNGPFRLWLKAIAITPLKVHNTASETIPKVPEIILSKRIRHSCPNFSSRKNVNPGNGKCRIMSPKAPTIIMGSTIERLR